jgi:hypothetical protein
LGASILNGSLGPENGMGNPIDLFSSNAQHIFVFKTISSTILPPYCLSSSEMRSEVTAANGLNPIVRWTCDVELTDVSSDICAMVGIRIIRNRRAVCLLQRVGVEVGEQWVRRDPRVHSEQSAPAAAVLTI